MVMEEDGADDASRDSFGCDRDVWLTAYGCEC